MIFCDSEISALKSVVVHRPDMGVSRVTPKRSEELLFDDIVFLPEMQKEHDVFTELLHAFVGKDNVHEFENLLIKSLEVNEVNRIELIEKVAVFEELPDSMVTKLREMENDYLAEVLITGYDRREDWFYFDPIPNLIFTRDIAVTIKDHVLITKAAKEARQRENLLTRMVVASHPLFTEVKKANREINTNDIEKFPPSRKGEVVSIEGGDVMMLNKDYLLIGCSERSSGHAFDSVKEYVLSNDVIKYVVKINIPADRSFMHIDTIFTRVDVDDLVCFKPIVYDGLGSNVEVYTREGLKNIYGSVKDFFLQEINASMQFIFSGMGESPYQEREQWTDSCNLFVIRPGVAISYDRNLHTLKGFEAVGYRVMTAQEVLDKHKNDPHFASNLVKTIITLPSSELSRARGGSHCMTCPIVRKPL